jgi:hypothetical protein
MNTVYSPIRKPLANLPKGADDLVHPKVKNLNGIISNTAQQEVGICKQYNKIVVRGFPLEQRFLDHTEQSTVIPRFTSLIRSSKTTCSAKTRKTKINFPLLPVGNNDRSARGRSSYKRKLVRKSKKLVLICASRISENS